MTKNSPGGTVRVVVADATEAGAIRPGPDVLRAIAIIAGTNGVLMTSALSRWDDGLFQGRAMAQMMAHDLFLGWGADPDRLEEAEALVDELDQAGQLVPPLRR